MAELMSKEDFLDLFYVMAMGQDKRFIEAVEQVVNDTPTINEHGHWIWNEDDEPYCSVCGNMDNLSSNEYFYRDKIRFAESLFCPHCGAKME